LIGTNQLTITPTGWVQEEENLKVVLDEDGRPLTRQPVVAQEIGLNRYERLAHFDDSAGRHHRERTEAFRAAVRAGWDESNWTRARFSRRAAPDHGQLFTPLLEYGEKLYDGAALEPVTARTLARETVGSYLAGSRGQ